MAEFKDMIHYLRKREHLTQKELADKVGVSPGTIAMYELGKRMPTVEVEEALADYFNVSLDVLRGRDNPNEYAITADEYKLILAYRELPKAEQGVVKRICAYTDRFSVVTEGHKIPNFSEVDKACAHTSYDYNIGVNNEDRKDTLG